MATTETDIWLAGAKLAAPFHACAFVANQDEEDRIFLPFIAAGIELGDKCINVLCEDEIPTRMVKLASVGINVKNAQSRGQLDLRPWQQAYLENGKFEPLDLLTKISQLSEAVEPQFRATRVWAKPDWSACEFSSMDELVEYEARFNALVPRLNAAFVCVYDLRKITAADAMRVLRVHPITIIGGTAAKNSHFVPLADILREIYGPSQFY